MALSRNASTASHSSAQPLKASLDRKPSGSWLYAGAGGLAAAALALYIYYRRSALASAAKNKKEGRERVWVPPPKPPVFPRKQPPEHTVLVRHCDLPMPVKMNLSLYKFILEHRMMLINGRCDFRLQVPSLPIASLPTPFDIAYKNEYSGATKTFARAISEPVLLETPTAFDLRDPSPLDSYVRSPHHLTNLCVQYINTSNDPDLKRQYHPGTTLMPLAAIRTVKP